MKHGLVNCLRRLAALVVALGWSANAAATDVILDVLEIADRSAAEVTALIGEPSRCDETYQGLSCNYGDEIEIIYINGRADWIQVTPKAEIPFEPTALKHLGLLVTLPLVRNPFRMHWDGHQGLAIVSLYGSGSYVALFQVRSITRQ